VALAFNLLLARIQRISRSRRRAVHQDFDDDEIQEAVDA
jgi:chromosome partitioning protein